MAKKKTKAKQKPIALPNKLSELIHVALADLEAVERSSKYRVEMDSVFHSPASTEFGETQCTVCFAGAVMAKSCGLKPTQSSDSLIDNKTLKRKFFALDNVRQGNVAYAIECLYGTYDEWDDIGPNDKTSQLQNRLQTYGIWDDNDFSSYEKSPLEFKTAMHGIAAKLQYAGL